MKVVFTAIGTAGDVQPFIALSKALAARGHDTTICSYKLHGPKCLAAGVQFRAVAPDVTRSALNGENDAALRRKNNMRTQLKFLIDMFLNDGEQRFRDCIEATRGADVIVCHHMDFPGQLAAIKNGVPWVTVGYCPFVVPNEDWAPHYERLVDFGPAVNKALWKVSTWVQDRFLFKRVAKFCAGLGIPRKGHWTWMTSPHLNIIAASPAVAVVPKTFAPKTIVSGSWDLKEPSASNPALDAFLAKGPAPVVVTFGSMGSNNAEEMTTSLIAAIRGVGLRAVIQSGWAGLQQKDARDDVLFIDYVPHDQLFRNARCVIHHGGAGTSAAATRAGVPSIVVAHGADQYYWAQCLQRLGVAPKPLRLAEVTVSRLKERLEAVEANPKMARNARQVASVMATEDGLQVAVAALEDLVRAQGRRVA